MNKRKTEEEIEKRKAEFKATIKALEFKLYPPEVQWLFKNQELLNVFATEAQIGLKPTTLQRFFKQGHRLSERHWEKAIKWVQKFQKME